MEGTGSRHGSPTVLDERMVDQAIVAAAHADCEPVGEPEATAELLALLTDGFGARLGRRVVARRVTALIGYHLQLLRRDGWETEELPRVVRRRAGGAAAAMAEDQLQPGAATRLDPDSAGWPRDLRAAVEVLGVLEHLPPLPRLGSTVRARPAAGGDPPALKRIRALLAKAESTEYADEADAFMAKAQELMTRHCIDRALAEVNPEAAPEVTTRRLWLEDPYLEAKALLLSNVAVANRCRAVVTSELGFSTLVGHPDDLEATELLFTSLLVQATRRITALGGEQGPRARKPSFRRSFLVAYATRIGIRLQEQALEVTREADEATDQRLLPVLARRAEHVDVAVEELFGPLDRLNFSATDPSGWAAGRAAADLADLAVQDTLPYVVAS